MAVLHQAQHLGQQLQVAPRLPDRSQGGAQVSSGFGFSEDRQGLSLKTADLEQGDVVPNYDFRGLYSTILEDYMHLDAKPLVGGAFEKLAFVA